jgi:hypothetical protein
MAGKYDGMSVKDAARLVYLEEERSKYAEFTDRVVIHDHSYNPGTLLNDGTTEGREGSQFDYLWNFYQGYKRNPAAHLTIMAAWERKAIDGGATN